MTDLADLQFRELCERWNMSILIMLHGKMALSQPEVEKNQLCVKLYFTWRN